MFDPLKVLRVFAPGIVSGVGMELRNKDLDDTGAEDALGATLIAIAPLTGGNIPQGNALLKVAREGEAAFRRMRVELGDPQLIQTALESRVSTD